MKIVYTGIQQENYNYKRRFSFEYSNFYLTLKKMAGVVLIEYPLDLIIDYGKKKFNQDLLDLIKREKPDLFFSFMFTDELDYKTLLEIKKITKSVAWFSDDSWRFYNYSKYLAPYFAWVVTTYSWVPKLYEQLGFHNVIRSQWGSNPEIWRSVSVERDIGVSFVGQYNAGRKKMIKTLREAGIDIFVRGWGWPEGRVSQDEMIRIFSRSKICLNINSQPPRFRIKSFARLFFKRSAGKIIPDPHFVDNFFSWINLSVPQIKARPFELAACKTFVISGFADDLDKFYKEDGEMVFYRTTDELIEKIKYYLPLDEERKKIAEAGYKRTLAEHTYEQRFKDIFKAIGLKYE